MFVTRERRMSEQRLAADRQRRDPERSPEPAGRRGRRSQRPRFVIQEHSARTHHFDFRLEVDGVLKSWAVPKGPSTDPREKRLAVPVEDHPLDYADFEGMIAQGEYGAGAVIVWDRGHYDNRTEQGGRLKPVGRALRDGHLVIELHGEKLTGSYALQRVAAGDDERWLLIKLKDAAADARRRPTASQRQSVISGRTIADLEREAQHADG
jgi:DNA ligase D-like protein (predicted 3'-phosphoesterase)